MPSNNGILPLNYVLVVPHSELKASNKAIIRVLIVLLIVASCVSVLVSHVFGRKIASPLVKITEILKNISDGDGDLTDVYIESVVYKGEHNEIILESDERKWLMLSDVDEQVATYVPLNFDFDKAKFEVVQDAEG